VSSPVHPPSEKTMLGMLVALVAVLGALAAGSAAGPAAAPAPLAAPAIEAAAVIAPAPVPAPVAAPAAPAVPALAAGTPCSSTADACVDLSSRRAWLLDGAGNVTYGPVGALGGTRRDPTPTGTFSVDYKDRDHVSNLYDADMPNSVFFAPAIAFHQGSLSERSHGCIHLGRTASQRFFSNLSPGDTVQVVS
jgi:lipoprotein-anchoring transpeptidase ErfK/SrfK